MKLSVTRWRRLPLGERVEESDSRLPGNQTLTAVQCTVTGWDEGRGWVEEDSPQFIRSAQMPKRINIKFLSIEINKN